jgi:hypothetical protein
MTKSIFGRSLILHGTYLNLFGPINGTGEHLFENTGSIIMFTFPPTHMTAVECPIQVYLTLLSGHLNYGFLLIGSLRYNSFKSSGIPLFSYFLLHFIKALIIAQNPFVMKLSLISSNRGSNLEDKQYR